MMMAAGAVDMAVLELFRGRFSHARHCDVEMQCLIRERLIPVESDHVAHHGRRRTVGLSLKRLLQSGDEVPVAVNVSERFPAELSSTPPASSLY